MALFGGQRGGIFAPPERPGYATPGIGEGVTNGPLGPDIDAALAENAANPRPSFFGEGGMGRHIAGSIGDMLLQRGGNSPIYAPTAQARLRQRMEEVQAEREERRFRDRHAWQREFDAANPTPRIMQAGDQILSVPGNGQGAPRVIYDAPDKAPQPGEQERLLELWSKLPDSDPRKTMIGFMLRGANLRPDIYQPKVNYETESRLRVKTTAPGKAASTGGKGGGKAGKPKPNSDLDYLRGN